MTAGGPSTTQPLRLRAWQRLSVRTVGLLVGMTLLATGVVGTLVYQHKQRELQATLGALLLNIARTGALLVDPALHTEVRRTLSQDSDAYGRVRAALAAIQKVLGDDERAGPRLTRIRQTSVEPVDQTILEGFSS